MTDYYRPRHNEQTELQYNVGDIVAAPFEVDGKMYVQKHFLRKYIKYI